MAVTAKFQADFSSFLAAVDKAELALVDFSKGASRVESSLNRMVDNFSGRKVIQEAVLMTTAVDEIGGVSKLTGEELRRVGEKAAEAATKMKALGYDVPPRIQAIADAADQSSTKLNDLGVSIARTAAGFATAQVAINAVTGTFRSVIGFVTESIDAWGKQEQATERLGNALRTQRVDVENVLPAYVKMASALQAQTTYADEDLHAMQALLVQVGGVMPAQMERALKASTDLAAGLGIDLHTATNLVAKAAAGHTETLARYGITVSQAELATKGFSAVLEQVETHFGGQAQAAAESYAGRVAQLKNTWNDLQETIGKFIVTNPLVIKAMNDLNDSMKSQQANVSGADQSWSGFLANQIGRFTALIPVVNDATKALALYLATKEQQADDENERRRMNDLADALKKPFDNLGTAAPTTASAWQAVLSDMDKAKQVSNDLAEATNKLSEGQKRAALDAFQHGRSVADATLAMRAYWPDIDKSKIALEALHRTFEEGKTAAKEHARELANAAKEIEKAQAEAASAYIPLSLAQRGEAKDLLALNVSHQTIAKSIGATVTQVNEFAKALDMARGVESEEVKLIATDLSKSLSTLSRNLLGARDSWNEYHNGITVAGDVMSRVTIPLFSKLPGVVAEGTKEIKDATASIDAQALSVRLWGETLNQLATGFRSLSTTGDESFDRIAKRMSTVLTVGGQLLRNATDINKILSQTGQIGAAGYAAIATGILDATFAMYSFVQSITAEQNAERKAAVDAQFARDLAADFHSAATFADELTAAIEHQAGAIAAANIQRAAQSGQLGPIAGPQGPIANPNLTAITEAARREAEALNLTAIIDSLGGVAHLAGDEMKTVYERAGLLFDIVKRGGADGSQALTQLDGTLSAFAQNATKNGGLVDQFFLNALNHARQLGLQLDEVNKFIGDQIKNNIVAGVDAFAGAYAAAATTLADAQDKLKTEKDVAKIADLNKSITAQKQILDALGISSERAGDALAGSLVMAWSELQKQGVPILQILGEMAPAIDHLGQQLKDAGLDGGAVFQELNKEVGLMKDQFAGPVITALNGLGQTLGGLHNIGMLNQDTFSGLVEQFEKGYEALDAQGKGGMTALRLLQQPLQTIWELQHKYGLQVDANTQKLLDQAEANHIVGEDHKSISEQMLDATKGIQDAVEGLAHVFGVVLPSDIEKAQKKMQEDAAKMQADLQKITPPDLTIKAHLDISGMTPDEIRAKFPNGGAVTTGGPLDRHLDYAARGGRVTSLGVQYFGDGGVVAKMLTSLFQPRGTDTVPAMLTPGEMVLPKNVVEAFRQNVTPMPKATDSGDLYLTLTLDGSVVTKTVIRNIRYNKDGAYTEGRGALGLAS